MNKLSVFIKMKRGQVSHGGEKEKYREGKKAGEVMASLFTGSPTLRRLQGSYRRVGLLSHTGWFKCVFKLLTQEIITDTWKCKTKSEISQRKYINRKYLRGIFFILYSESYWAYQSKWSYKLCSNSFHAFKSCLIGQVLTHS